MRKNLQKFTNLEHFVKDLRILRQEYRETKIMKNPSNI